MKRILAALLGVLLLITSPGSAFDWSKQLADVRPSVVRLLLPNGSCTAFSINEKEGYLATAAHCINVGGMPAGALLIVKNEDIDAAVIKSGLHLPALRPRLDGAKQGEEALYIGYPADGLVVLGAIIANDDYLSAPDHRSYQFFDQDAINGMSGGPIIDTKGRVIGIVQQGNNRLGWGSKMKDIYKGIGRYWSVFR